MKNNLSIGLVELYATENGGLFNAKLKDLYSLVRLPSRAIELLAAILRKAGYSCVETYNPNYNRFGGRFHPKELKALAEKDVVGISSISRTQPASFELARRLKEINPKIRILFGGPHVTAYPDEALQYGDVVVRREGDVSITEVMERFAEDLENPCFIDVQGVSYRDAVGQYYHNEDRRFLTSAELSDLPFPENSPLVRKKITYNMVVSSRGCPFQCDFCSVITHFGSQYRFMDVETTVALIEHTLRQTRKPIFFGDDNFCARPARTKAILEMILQKGISMPAWGAQVRVEASQDRELLSLMKRAGCTRLYVGLESINEETLQLFNKKSNCAKNEEAIRRFHDAGFSIHGMFVVGSDEDTIDTLWDTVAFAKKMMIDTAQFFSLTALPGTPLTARYLEEGKVISQDWHLYDAHRVVVRPAKIPSHLLQKEIVKAHLDFYSFKEALRYLIYSQHKRDNAQLRIFGNLLTRKIQRQMKPYCRQLEALENWSEEVEGRYQRLRRQLDRKVQSLGKGFSLTGGSVRAALEEFITWLPGSLEALPEIFLPYCRQKGLKKIEKINRILASEASEPEPTFVS